MREKLINICTPRQWKTLSTSELKDEGYTVYGANGVIGYYSEYNHEAETVMITCRGATCGTVNISKPYSYINGNAMCMDDLRHDIDVKYLYYALKNYDFKEVISGSAQPQITRQGLNSVFVEVVAKPRQLEIVKVLSNIEETISRKQQQLAKYDQLIKSRFVEMFGDPVKNTHEWEIEKLGVVCDVRDGTHDSPKYVNDGYPLITSKNVVDGYIDFTNVNMISKEDLDSINKRSKVDLGDILMPMIGTIGNPIIVKEDKIFAIKNVALIKFDHQSKVINTYIKALLESDYFENAVSGSKRGGTQKFISLGNIRTLPIAVPPIELQNEFALLVQQVDKLKFVVQKSLNETQELFDSLMQKYFG